MKLAVVTLLIVLWMSSQPRPPTQPESAQLILYREKEFISGLKGYTFKINEQPMGKLAPNRYVQLTLPPGRVTIEFVSDYLTDSRPLRMQVQAGKTYYVKVAVEGDFISVVLVMAPVDEQQARQELLRMKPERANTTRQPD